MSLSPCFSPFLAPSGIVWKCSAEYNEGSRSFECDKKPVLESIEVYELYKF
jgi:hypothetical protein